MWIRTGAVSNPSVKTTLQGSAKGSNGQTYGPPVGTSCGGGCLALTLVYQSLSCHQGTLQGGYCTDVERVSANQWSQNCCIFGRVTSIAVPTAYSYLGGYTFGGVGWSNAKTDYYPATSPPPGQGEAFAYAGGISYPNSTSFVSIAPGFDNYDEADTLYAPTSY